MKICLDTNAYTALKKKHEDVIHLVENSDSVLMPAIVLGELHAGFLNGTQIKKNLAELNDFLSLPGVEIIPIDEAIAERYGIVLNMLRKQGVPVPTNDIWIAAVAFETGARLITFDKHFNVIPGLATYSPI